VQGRISLLGDSIHAVILLLFSQKTVTWLVYSLLHDLLYSLSFAFAINRCGHSFLVHFERRIAIFSGLPGAWLNLRAIAGMTVHCIPSAYKLLLREWSTYHTCVFLLLIVVSSPASSAEQAVQHGQPIQRPQPDNLCY
jgi:hypothetical protein